MPSASASSAPPSAHSSSNWYQSAPERASRDISMPSTSPTCPMVISVTSRWNPARPAALAQTCRDPRRSPAPARSASPARPPAPPARTAAGSTPHGRAPAGGWTGAHTPPPAAQDAGRPPCCPAAPTATARSWPPPFTGQVPDPGARRPHVRQPYRHHPAGQHRQPPNRHPAVGLRQPRPGLLDRPLWGQDLPPSSTTTRPPRHAHGPAAGPRPRPAATAPHVRVSAFVLLGQCSCVHSAWQLEQGHKQVKNELGWADFQVRSDRAIRRHLVLVCCAFSFCWHATHATPDAQPVDSPPGHPPPAAPAHPAAPTAARGAIGTTPSAVGTRRIVAAGAASSPRLADPMARAAALVAGVVALPATPGRAGPADVGRSGQTAGPLH